MLAGVPSPMPSAPPRDGSSLRVGAAILLSRVVGLVRQRVIAHYLGLGPTADAFAAAMRLGNVAQNLLGEGALSATLIPSYARLRKTDPQAAKVLAQGFLGWLALLASGFSLAMVALAPVLTHLLAPGFDAARAALTTDALRWIAPMAGVLVVGAWGLGVLNTHRQFFLPYAAPILWSLAQIVGLWLGAEVLSITGAGLLQVLCLASFVGATLQGGLLVVAARRAAGISRPSLERSAPLRDAAASVPSVILGRGVVQISAFIDTALASLTTVGANAALGYAQTMFLLPMSFLGTAEAAAALPALSEVSENKEAMRARQAASLTRILALGVVASIGLVTLAGPLVHAVFVTGSFDASSETRVAALVAIYGLALLPNAAGRLFATSLYACRDAKRVSHLALVRLALSAVLSFALLSRFGERAIVMGSGVAAFAEAGLLATSVQKRMGAVWTGVPLFRIGWVALGATAASVGSLYALSHASLPSLATSWLALIVYGGASLGLLQATGLVQVGAMLRSRLKR